MWAEKEFFKWRLEGSFESVLRIAETHLQHVKDNLLIGNQESKYERQDRCQPCPVMIILIMFFFFSSPLYVMV